uniref:DNA-directed RNA polymerase n=1 Tax=Psilocybe cubensis TaxID=181762 RepID=A0A8H7XSX2_PSICU
MGKYPIPPHLNRDDPSRSLMMFAHAKPLGAYMGFAGLRSMRQICSGRDRTDLPKEISWQAASYLAKQLLSTIGDTFKGAKGIQDWPTLCMRLISKSVPASRLGVVVDVVDGKNEKKYATLGRKEVKREQMTSVIWTTLLGLPIVQPYRKISTTAFPPNFIHSLDATHMLLTAIKCNDRGLTFASIHDSYWTHACDIDTMSEAIRETFISLHQSDILNKLQQATPPQAQWSDSPRHRLKIPAANLFGYDKAGSTSVFSGLRSTLSKCGRRRRTRSMYGMRWWQKADDPWQFLAACIELTK